jgi:hypothetical protein
LNTKFFHAYATSRKKLNRILSLENDAGIRVTDKQGLCQIAKGYFEEIFLENQSNRAPMLAAMDNVVLVEDNDFLTAPFQVEEFKEAMYYMHPDKCPGPDGFNPGLFQKFWSVCNPDIFSECSWLNNNQFPRSLNSTNIALIPKGNEQHIIKD